LYLTYHHVCYHSSILGFTKQKIWSLKDVNSVWKTDGLIGGLSMNVENHGEIAFTIPTNCENVYTVFDQLLKMKVQDNNLEDETKNNSSTTATNNSTSGIIAGNNEITNEQKEQVEEQTAKWF
jgi:hypothetical protein